MPISRTDAPDALNGGLVVAGALLGLAIVRAYNYLLFHSLVEVFTVAVGWSIFLVAWNARRWMESHYLLLIGIGSIFAGTFDLVHTLTYRGLGIVPNGGDLPTQFWIAARAVQSISFFVAPLFIGRKLNHRVAFGVYAAGTVALFALIGRGLFPSCYVEGRGLTHFKVAAEYVVIVLFVCAGWALARSRKRFDASVFAALAGSLALMVAAELEFTFYAGVYGRANEIGHLLRFTSACLLCRAVVVTGITRPTNVLFRDLAQSQAALRRSDERYRAFLAGSAEGIWRAELTDPIDISLDVETQVHHFFERARIEESNEAFAHLHGRQSARQMVALPVAAMGSGLAPGRDFVAHFIRSGYRVADAEIVAVDAAGVRRWTTASLSGVVEEGRLVRVWGVQRDITAQMQAALERERLIGELQRAVAEIRRLTGLLPICAKCKKIRDDQGYWKQVETYISERADVAFSHGICPECLRALYPEFQHLT